MKSRNTPNPLSGRTRRARGPKPVGCQICGAPTRVGLDLGMQPIGDLLRTEAQLNQPETLYPMRMQHCDHCGLTQLSYVVNPSVVYRHFPFVSGTTATATRHLQSLPASLAKHLGLGRNHFAVDIGSKDGTLLKGWLPFDVKFLGVDPAGDPVRIANEQRIPTLHAFFNAQTAAKIKKKHGPADVITACGCFAHIADLDGVMRGIDLLLKNKGVFASDNQYWLDMVQRLHYDNAFHQHLRYYAIRPLKFLFAKYGLEVFDVERSDTYGGQIRVYGCRQGAYPIADRVRELERIEEEAKLYDPQTHVAYARAVEEKRRRLFDTVYKLKRAGKKVIGVGAPAKASTVCTYCHIGPDLIDYITEINPLRIGMYLPGVRVPIVDEEFMFKDPRTADAAVLFAWNYADEVVPKLRQRGFRGEIILP